MISTSWLGAEDTARISLFTDSQEAVLRYEWLGRGLAACAGRRARGATAARRDETPVPAAPAGEAASLDALERLAADVHAILAVDRVTVVVSDDDEPGSGRVQACFGPGRFIGSRISVIPEPVTGPMTPAGAVALGIGDAEESRGTWTFAQVPIGGPAEPLGAITVACRGAREFTEHDLDTVERLARSRASLFQRGDQPRTPRA